MASTRINYIEFPATDFEATKAFYAKAFGWTFKEWGEQYLEFDDGAMKGGFTTMNKLGEGGTLTILYTEDLEGMEKKVREAGGEICKPIFSFPGGRRFHFKDPNGNELAIWSDK